MNQENVQFGPVDLLYDAFRGIVNGAESAGPLVWYPVLIVTIVLLAWYFKLTFLILPMRMMVGISVHVTYWAKGDEGGAGAGGPWLGDSFPWLAPYVPSWLGPLQGVGKAILSGHSPSSDLSMKHRMMILTLIYFRIQMSIAFILIYTFLVLNILMQFPIFHLTGLDYRTVFGFLENTRLYCFAALGGFVSVVIVAYTVDDGRGSDGGSDMDVVCTIVCATVLWIVAREFDIDI